MLIQFIANGIVNAAIYILVAFGFALVYNTTKVFHIAYAVLYMVAPYLVFTFHNSLELSFLPSVFIALIITTLLSMLIEWQVYRPLVKKKSSLNVIMISSIGVMIVGINLVAMLYGNDSKTLINNISKSINGSIFAYFSIILSIVLLAVFLLSRVFKFINHTVLYSNKRLELYTYKKRLIKKRIKSKDGIQLLQAIISLVFITLKKTISKTIAKNNQISRTTLKLGSILIFGLFFYTLFIADYIKIADANTDLKHAPHNAIKEIRDRLNDEIRTSSIEIKSISVEIRNSSKAEIRDSLIEVRNNLRFKEFNSQINLNIVNTITKQFPNLINSSSFAYLIKSVSDLNLTYTQLWQFAISSIAIAFILIFLSKSNFGNDIKAIQNGDFLSSVYAVQLPLVKMRLFGLSGLLAGLGGILVAYDVGMDPHVGMPMLLNIVVAIIIGGVGRFDAIIVGGLFLGIIQSVAVWQYSANWKEAITFLVLILFLILKPEGIMGIKQREV